MHHGCLHIGAAEVVLAAAAATIPHAGHGSILVNGSTPLGLLAIAVAVITVVIVAVNSTSMLLIPAVKSLMPWLLVWMAFTAPCTCAAAACHLRLL